MKIDFSPKQKEIINSMGQNLLVSAGAGSGKTTTMVEHILKLVCEDHIPIDSMLIVTFTRAATSDMKAKLTKSLLKRETESTDKEWLALQVRNINKTDICTIDSFCQKILKQNFHLTDIDPGYRIPKTGVAEAIKRQAIDDILEEGLSNKDEELDFLIRSLSLSGDEATEEAILSLYDFALSIPFYKKWIKGLCERYENSYDELINIIKGNRAETFLSVKQGYETFFRELNDTYSLSSDDPVCKILLSDISEIEAHLQNEDHIPEFIRWNAKKSSLPPEIIEGSKKLRTDYAKKIKDLFKTTSKISDEKTLYKAQKRLIKTLSEYTLKFADKYDEYKKDNSYLEFSDISQLTLGILVNEDLTPTEIAQELKTKYRKIIIDEYQDTNSLQEAIFNAIRSKDNHFAVGDVKQSIYKFRNAEPDIFIQKYNDYSQDENAKDRLIILSENYRSRKEVTESVNLIFKRIMTKESGGIEYDDESELKYAANYDDLGEDNKTEFYIIEKDKGDEQGEDAVDELNNAKKEATIIAERILELINKGFKIKDGDNVRAVNYSDIVILMRSLTDAADITEELAKYNIPCIASKGTSLLESAEVAIMLSLFKALDNPLRSLELVCALHSNLFGFTENELTCIKIGSKASTYYEKLNDIAQNGENEALKKKTSQFLEVFQKLKRIAHTGSPSSLLNYIYYDLDYLSLIRLLPSGELRVKNLYAFLKEASSYEKTIGGTLAAFVTYFEQAASDSSDKTLLKATIGRDNANAVNLITVHASKGLEYPIVIYAMTGKQFNKKDIGQNNLILDKKYGINLSMKLPLSLLTGKSDDNLPDFTVRTETLSRSAFKIIANRELIAEEMRLMYVAMTRAKEKLIVIGNTRQKVELKHPDKPFTSSMISGANSPLDLLLAALTYPVFDYGEFCTIHELNSNSIKSVHSEDTAKESEFKEFTPPKEFNEDIINGFTARFDIAEKTKHIIMPSSRSISEIKRAAYSHEEKLEQKIPPLPPSFMQEKRMFTAAQIGTLYHKAFELLPLDMTEEGLPAYLESLLKRGFIDEDEFLQIKTEHILAFMNSPLFKRLKKAEKIQRETSFALLKKKDTEPGAPESIPITLRGIIDLFFIENDEAVIVDYKTDRYDDKSELLQKYAVQLDLYKEALEAAGYKVKEGIIYTVYKKETIKVF